MIRYEKMSLFDVADGEIIVHACNAQGIWASGIAKEFKTRYPSSYKEYQVHCKDNGPGSADLSTYPAEEKHWVGWLITSENYGNLVDDPETIKINTTIALIAFCKKVYTLNPSSFTNSIVVYSNKFNSGLFKVLWKDTERILNIVLKDYPRIKWIVCDPNL